jgi:hypothetical protein
MFLTKLLVGLIGLVFTIAGGLAMVVGIPWVLLVVVISVAGETPDNAGLAVLCGAGGFIVAYVGAVLGRFARGDYD